MSEGYCLGFRNGIADRLIGFRSMIAWLDHTDYGTGYRAAFSEGDPRTFPMPESQSVG